VLHPLFLGLQVVAVHFIGFAEDGDSTDNLHSEGRQDSDLAREPVSSPPPLLIPRPFDPMILVMIIRLPLPLQISGSRNITEF